MFLRTTYLRPRAYSFANVIVTIEVPSVHGHAFFSFFGACRMPLLMLSDAMFLTFFHSLTKVVGFVGVPSTLSLGKINGRTSLQRVSLFP